MSKVRISATYWEHDFEHGYRSKQFGGKVLDSGQELTAVQTRLQAKMGILHAIAKEGRGKSTNRVGGWLLAMSGDSGGQFKATVLPGPIMILPDVDAFADTVDLATGVFAEEGFAD